MMQIQNPISGKFFLPLPLGYIWSFANSFEEIRENYVLKDLFIFRETAKEIAQSLEAPEFFCVSTYVWNWEISKSVCRDVKKRWPHCKIVMGGPQVPYQPGFAKELEFLDFVVTFEGEEQFKEILIENLKPEPNFDSIAGLLTRSSKSFQKRIPQKEIDQIPSPYLSGFYDSLIKKAPPDIFNMIIETNRGCPYSCSFCDMQDTFYNKIRQFNLERVKEELDWASANKIDYIECADSNFGFFHRDLEIIQHMIKLKTNTGYPRSFNFTSAKNQPENVELIQKELIENELKRGISISLQSFNPSTLKAISRWNSKKDILTSKISRYKSEGYESYIELIVGLPEETKNSWLAGIGELIDSGYEGSLLVHPLSVVPNTPFSDPGYIEKYGLKYTVTKSPAQGFCYGTESPEEREMICYSTSTLSLDDWIDCYYFAKTIVGAYYYHGLLTYLVKYIQKERDCLLSELFFKLLDYAKVSDGFLGKEWRNSNQLLRETLFELRPWGRKIFGDEDMYWSDQAASAMAAIKAYDDFSEDLITFVEREYDLRETEKLRDLLKFNFEMLERPQRQIQSESRFAYNWREYFFDHQPLEHRSTRYRFLSKFYKDYRDHALNIYWYGRKSRRCFVRSISDATL